MHSFFVAAATEEGGHAQRNSSCCIPIIKIIPSHTYQFVLFRDGATGGINMGWTWLYRNYEKFENRKNSLYIEPAKPLHNADIDSMERIAVIC